MQLILGWQDKWILPSPYDRSRMKRRNEGSRHRYWPDKERVLTAETCYFRTRIDERERKRKRERPDASRIKARRDEDKRIAPLEYQWRTRRNRVFEKNGFKVECGGTRSIPLDGNLHIQGVTRPDFFGTVMLIKKPNIPKLLVFGELSYRFSIFYVVKRRTCPIWIRREISPCDSRSRYLYTWWLCPPRNSFAFISFFPSSIASSIKHCRRWNNYNRENKRCNVTRTPLPF